MSLTERLIGAGAPLPKETRTLLGGGGVQRAPVPVYSETLRSATSAELNESLIFGTGLVDPDANLTASQGGSAYYRRLTTGARDLPQIIYEKTQNLAFQLFSSNPMAKRIINLVKDAAIGAGVTASATAEDDAEREAIQSRLDLFWNDALNRMDLKLPAKVRELGIFGEQIWPVFVNPKDGHVRLGTIDPSLVSAVLTDPENVEIIRELVLKGGGGASMGPRYKVVTLDEDPVSTSYQRWIGLTPDEQVASDEAKAARAAGQDVSKDEAGREPYAGACFYFRVNAVTSAKRGLSDLLSVIDWVDGYDQLLFNELDRALLAKLFVWDVKLIGKQENEIVAWAKEHGRQPAPASVRAHNENVEWNAVAPSLNSSDAAVGADLIAGYIATGAGLPKAQPLDCKVLTPTGWREMGTLDVGDEVLTPQGMSTKIIGVYPQGIRQVFEVTFSDGARTRATGEHLWFTQTAKDRDRHRPGRVRTTDEIAGSIKKGARWNHYVPLVVPVPGEDSELPIDPYVLGTLLGDGHMRIKADNGTEILLSSGDPELVDAVNSAVPVGEFRYTGHGVDYRYTYPHKRGPFKVGLRGLGLCGTKSCSKFIPKQYLMASPEQRLALLQGLLDTDGSPSAKVSARYVTVSPRLARDVRDLVWGLGGVCTQAIEKNSYLHRGEKRAGAPAFAIRITLPEGVPYFRLERKQSKIVPAKKTGRAVRTVRKIEPVGNDWCQCIKVENADQLYVTDDYIVTHNTWLNGVLDVNRATAESLSEPAFLSLTERQNYVRYIVESVLTFVLDQAEIVGALPTRSRIANSTRPEEWPFVVNMPELRSKDLASNGAALKELADALVEMRADGVIDEQAEREVFMVVLRNLGVEIDGEEMIQRIAAEKEEAAASEPSQNGNGLLTIVQGQAPQDNAIAATVQRILGDRVLSDGSRITLGGRS